MTAAARAIETSRRRDVLSFSHHVGVFTARAEARALLWQAGEFDLHDAVDELQAAAERDGLLAKLGQDAVQKIISKAFGVVR